MHSISNKALALFKAHSKQTVKISVMSKSGNSFVLTEADILTNGFKLNRSSVSGGTVELGSVIASELDLTLENYNERFQGTAFEGAKLFVSICVTDGLAEYPVDFGYFTVDEVLKGKNAITITALDRMVKFDKEIEADFFTDNPNDTFDIIDENLNKIYADSETKLVWKFYSSDKTVSELVKRICYFCGIRLKTDLSTLPNHDYTVVSIPQTDGLTYRHLLSWCCQIMGVCAYMDSDGTLVLRWYSESGVELDVGERYDSVIGENSIVLNRLTITVADKTYTSGTGSYAIDLTGNMLVQTNPQEMLDNLCSAIGGLTYIPFTAETVPFPQLEPLDKINIIDKNGNIYPTIITNWTFSLNNSTILAGQGTSETKNNYAAAAPFTPAQSFVIEKKSNEIKDEFDSKIEQTRTSILLEVSGKYATGEEVSSALKVTNEAITSEVSRAQSAESGLSSSISQNAEAITSEVTRAKNAESSMSSLIQQNADNILLRVTKKDLSDKVASEVASEIEQSADTIRLKASKIVWQSDKSSMTEEGVLTAQGADIKGEITATKLTLSGCSVSASDVKGKNDKTLQDELYGSSTGTKLLFYKAGTAIKQAESDAAPTDESHDKSYFSVSTQGLLTAANAVIYGTVWATNGEFTGKIHATEGDIGGWKIGTGANGLPAGATAIFNTVEGTEGKFSIGLQANAASTANINFFVKEYNTESKTWEDVFYVKNNGELKATKAEITGKITATSGDIGGFKINASSLSCGSIGSDNGFLLYPGGSSTTYSVAGSDYKSFSMIVGSDFGITPSGKLHASGAEISGKITATSLTLGSNASLSKGTYSDTNSSTGCEISKDGLLKASNAIIRGTIYASGGEFSGTIKASTIKIGTYGSKSTGCEVSSGGQLKASNAIIYGEINAMGSLNAFGKIICTAETNSSVSNPRDNDVVRIYDNSLKNIFWVSPLGHAGAVSFYTIDSSGNKVGDDLQTQINGKASLSGATFSGKVYFTDSVESNYYRAGSKYIAGESGATIGESGYASFGQTVTCKVLNQVSDRRLKNTISELDNSYADFFNKIKPVTFKFNNAEKFTIGFIAQDIQKALADSGHDTEQFNIVQKNEDGYYSMNHSQITALNTHMIQLANKKIQELEEKLELMKG